MKKVFFYYADQSLNLKGKKMVQQFVGDIFKNEKILLARLNYIFCSDIYLLEINKKHLKHNFFTDVVTFNLSESNKEIFGEVYISIDRVKENAFTLKISFEHEILRVIFHGALHLCGYNDESAADIKIMRKKEDYYLNAISGVYCFT